jgi:hypothetical protein
MKKLIMILLLLSSIIVLLQAKMPKTGWDLRGLKGHVKSCERTVGTENYKMLMSFDTNGNEISDTSWDYDQDKKAYVVSFTRISKYDANNNVIQKLETGYGEPSTIACKYNEKNQLIEEINSDSKESTKYTYDDKVNQTEKLVYSEDSETPSKTVSIYDVKGNEIQCHQYNSDGSLEWKNFYEYNEKGQMVDFYRKVTDTEYDEDTDEEYEIDNITVTRKAVYNEQGFLISEITESTDSYINSAKKTFTYTFDSNGNWTRKNILVEGEEPTFETQVIVYY